MKKMTFALVTLAASAALAFPSVKDKAEYKANYASAAGGDIDYTLKLEIMAYDSATNEYTLKNTQIVNGQENSADQKYTADQFPTNAQVQDLLANCEANGGKLETVAVPAGAFNTCAIDQQNGGKVWVAEVPFGFAKLLSVDEEGNKMNAELSSFEAGQ